MACPQQNRFVALGKLNAKHIAYQVSFETHRNDKIFEIIVNHSDDHR